VALLLVPVLVGLVGTWLGLAVFSRHSISMGPFDVQLSTSYGHGVTDIDLPPLGRLTANTHRAPLRFKATLEAVNVPQLTRILQDEGTDGLVEEVQRDALAHLGSYAAWAFASALIGALVLALLAFRTHWRSVTISLLTALVVMGGSELTVFATYHPSAFLSPTFSGSLVAAPQLIGKVRTATNRIEDFRGELEDIVDGTVRAYTSIQAGSLGAGPEIRLLHISDIHLNPLGMDFAREIADGFNVNAVVDTGDITSFGTPVENLILSDIAAFHRPYLFVRGNHDSFDLPAAIGKIPNARVLNGDVVRVAGLRIYGLADPAFTPNKAALQNDVAVAALDRIAARQLLSDVDQMGEPPDVIMVHDDRMAELVAGRVPLVISGHFHQQGVRVDDGTIFLRDGTTGGAGANVFTVTGGIPLTAEVLYFTTSTPSPTLAAWDVISQSPVTGSLTVTRHLVSEELGNPVPAVPSPTPTPTLTPSGTIQGLIPESPSVTP
jgi:predicted phosphodiesterase